MGERADTAPQQETIYRLKTYAMGAGVVKVWRNKVYGAPNVCRLFPACQAALGNLDRKSSLLSWRICSADAVVARAKHQFDFIAGRLVADHAQSFARLLSIDAK